MHSWKYMQTCGWALPLGYYPQVGALQFQRRAYRLKACALAEGWLKDQHQKALDGLASLEAVGWSRFNGGPGGQRFSVTFFQGPRGPMRAWTFTGNMAQHGSKSPPFVHRFALLKWASPNSDSGQESDEVQRAAAELLRSEKKLMKTALESGLFVWNIYILGQNAVYIDSYWFHRPLFCDFRMICVFLV